MIGLAPSPDEGVPLTAGPPPDTPHEAQTACSPGASPDHETQSSCVREDTAQQQREVGGSADSQACEPCEPSAGGAPQGEEEAPGSRQQPQQLSDAELAEEAALLVKADALKQEGNRLYGEGRLQEAADKYEEAIQTAPEGNPASAVYYANLAACDLRMTGRAAEAARACSDAISLDPLYNKAYMRRSSALEQLGDLDHALADARKVLELDSGSTWARSAISRLEPLVAAKHEALKSEMLGKLKELGNSVLGRFGMSIDNFKAEKDPSSGGYSIRFQQ